MTKQDLQKELLEKVKEGIKPSDLKRQKNNQDEGYDSDNNNSIPTPPPPPPITGQEKETSKNPSNSSDLPSPISIKEKDKEIKKLQEEIEELKKLKSGAINKELEQALIEANQKIRELETERNNWTNTFPGKTPAEVLAELNKKQAGTDQNKKELDDLKDKLTKKPTTGISDVDKKRLLNYSNLETRLNTAIANLTKEQSKNKGLSEDNTLLRSQVGTPLENMVETKLKEVIIAEE
ncbi:10411_t:CDS:2 [Ambispora gerdemannii]|uniref:10411_t:CDS:1 n=1 Tax=Ambispora gerdemannii TaxID=144530 RepID=A0A9N9CB65_9GLOM|nr:10411_t:CDS:2 [Ambispora gerdemannii]